MEKINKGIVFSDDIKRILSGINAFDYRYEFVPDDGVISEIRDDFAQDVNKIFNGNVAIIGEEAMMRVNQLIMGDYPHCHS